MGIRVRDLIVIQTIISVLNIILSITLFVTNKTATTFVYKIPYRRVRLA